MAKSLTYFDLINTILNITHKEWVIIFITPSISISHILNMQFNQMFKTAD
ncbi:hypothetical protein VCRA2116O29_870003 [Vibrio crassostreae]|nr:hypothetical protein VCRA2116O29_870003 [Vibrio crassostreae]CAK2571088.1 hypothetical protein VCRA2119O48_820003 [Vibrio crassostreae]CAK3921518.1 hypothetical protein VCRA2123O74_880005 [Vibrio crassostreae]CAK4025184.1 hypothetical protein VCRA212O16_880006 [Vibrio crassostreae]